MRGWYSRGYLPHCDEPGRVQFITFRLHDSMPREVLDAYDEALRRKEFDELERMRKIERYLDKGHGACWLRNPAIAQMIVDALHYFDGQRYHLNAWCVMPNHVHTLIETIEGHSLDSVTHSWKSYTALQANRILGRGGTFWQREVFDRYMRGVVHYQRTLFYIEDNPVAAGLVHAQADWPFSSARLRTEDS
ncbi:MAG: transposase [Candidatus Hydrogenedentes bacterium]|nr:transposase [Candidatus Hydrogenedentota bacterium]